MATDLSVDKINGFFRAFSSLNQLDNLKTDFQFFELPGGPLTAFAVLVEQSD